MDRQADEKYRYMKMDKRMNRQWDGLTGTEGWKNRNGRQTDTKNRQTEGQTDRWTEDQCTVKYAYRQTQGQTDTNADKQMTDRQLTISMYVES